jgi:hypothetical protein
MSITKFSASRPDAAHNEIYISRKRPLKVYYERCLKLAGERVPAIIIRGMGMACVSALDLAHMLEVHYPIREIVTGTMYLVDEVGEEKKIRPASTLHIKISC